MNRERWLAVEGLFAQALAQPPSTRAAWLERAAAGEPELRRLVEELLRADAEEDDLVARSIGLEAAALAGEARRGQRFGAWVVQGFLGAGGMSDVYLAARADEQFDKRVALKILKPGLRTEALVRRFQLERRLLGGLEHAGVARLIDAGTSEEGLPYFVMEYVDGGPLDRWCDERRLDLPGRVRLFRQVLAAVGHLHRNLVVHRDLKPSNVLVTRDGVAKVLDLGIATLVAPADVEARSPDGERAAEPRTPAYASPEQLSGAAITTASDIYSLGVLLCELLCGVRPASAAADADEARVPSELMQALLERDAPAAAALGARRGLDAGTLVRRLRGDLDAVVRKATAADPERRYASADAFAEDLRRHLERWPVVARRDTWSYRLGRFVARHRLPVATAALAALLVLAAGVGLAVQSRRLARERDRSERLRLRAERVSNLLVDVFQVSDPGVTQGRTVTARELLDRGAARVLADLTDEPQVQAAMLGTIARVYRQLGLYREALGLLSRASGLLRSGDDLEGLARAVNDLAVLHASLGEYAAAEPLFREALELRRRLHPAPHEALSASLNNLALLQHDRGELSDAARLYAEALRMDERLFGRRHAHTATDLMNLGLLRHDLGREDEAQALLREVLEIRETLLGPRHPDVGGVLAVLGRVLVAQGRLDEAEGVLQRALTLEREVRGGTHPDAARVWAGLADVARGRGRLAQAELLHRRALALRTATLGGDHPESLDSQVGLGATLVAAGRYAEAEARLAPALRRLSARLGARHPGLLPGYLTAAELALARGRRPEALRHMRAAREIVTTRLAPGHPAVARLAALEARTRRAPES